MHLNSATMRDSATGIREGFDVRDTRLIDNVLTKWSLLHSSFHMQSHVRGADAVDGPNASRKRVRVHSRGQTFLSFVQLQDRLVELDGAKVSRSNRQRSLWSYPMER